MDKRQDIQDDGTLILKHPVKLPDVLDLLIVGGGPAGTAAAFHAKEMGLNALVIDFDDILKRIRDYAKDKQILPSFGGGDKLKFPSGGNLVSKLHFGPIDKDEMQVEWKKFFVDNSIPAKIKVELTGLEKGSDAIWNAKVFNHNLKKDEIIKAKHVVLALGGGEPRRFDIPGNLEGVSYRLNDARAYVGASVCVLGGGTSAAEAVIAISNVKKEAGDKFDVCWSYRGTTMPAVSKALAEIFFEVHMNNGNIRYLPNSDAVAVVTAEDKNEYLSVRVDRRNVAGRPSETTHLEFNKEFCIACIGQDLPERILSTMGIYMAVGGPGDKKRMVVNRQLETQQKNVYLIGDLLSQAYFETADFNADPKGFHEIKHRGNIKSALRDGVYVAKVIASRLAGKPDTNIFLDEAEVKVTSKKEKTIAVIGVVEAQAPPAASLANESATETAHAWLIRILPGNVEENEYPLREAGVTTIGRNNCDINFSEDTLMSEQHASITLNNESHMLRDDGSANGVFTKATEGKDLELTDGDLLKVGRQYLMIEAKNGRFGFIHFDQNGVEKNRHTIANKTMVLGREAPDITLDSNDKTLSRRHLSLSVKDGKFFLKDLSSVNGTYLRVRDFIRLEQGSQFRIGQQLLCLTLRQDVVLNTGGFVVQKPAEPIVFKSSLPPEPTKASKPAILTTGGEPAVTFKNNGQRFTIKLGQTICDIAEANGLPINAECHAGMCGSDPIRIISGHENLNELTDGEKEALEDICELKPGECRLACMVKVKGPVEVEILKQ